MAGKGYVRVWQSLSMAVVSKMPKKTWQLNYKRILKESCVSILREVRVELPEPITLIVLEMNRGTVLLKALFGNPAT